MQEDYFETVQRDPHLMMIAPEYSENLNHLMEMTDDIDHHLVDRSKKQDALTLKISSYLQLIEDKSHSESYIKDDPSVCQEVSMGV